MPQPDLTALNGKVAVDAYASVDFPPAAIAECEAVRYTYLNDLPLRQAAARAASEPLRVLVLGDIVRASTHSVLKLLEVAISGMSVRPACTVKPHPNCEVEAGDYPALQARIVTNPLGEILQNFDIAFCAKLTSAGVDAYLAGLSVAVMLDGSELNFSPLRGLPGVRFVSTPDELAEALRAAGRGAAGAAAHNDFFFLDPELPRWKKLLGLRSGT
jgi:surface carbohydrate biosynthesis protein (TIGR04326 family)